ncbi:MAG: S24/S26 family peptidase [Pseudomonadota bacterium]
MSRWPMRVARVRGNSMAPGYLDGDFVIALRFPWMKIRRKQVVLAHHPDLGLILKRVTDQRPGAVLLSGDSPESTSTESMGWVSEGALYPVLRHIPKP